MADVDVSQQISEIKALQGEQLRATNDLSVFIGRLDERLQSYIRDLESYKKDNNRRVSALEDRADATERRIWRWSGALAVIVLIITLSVQYWPRLVGKSHDAPAYATEKRQNQYPPQRLPPQEGK